MGLENDHARPYIAKMFNQMENTIWIPNRNIDFAMLNKRGKAKSNTYVSGCPDAFVCSDGLFIAIECKAFARNAKMNMWSEAQENWWRRVALRSHMSYFIALWMYPEEVSDDTRIYQEKAYLFMLTPDAFIAQRDLAMAKCRVSCALLPEIATKSYKDISLLPRLEEYRCSFEGGVWKLPRERV